MFYAKSKLFGSLYSTSHSGKATKINFAKASSAGGEYLLYTTKPSTYANYLIDSNANKWYQCLDLEIINSLKESLYTGISTKGSTNTLRLNITRTLAAQTHAVHFYSCFDVILEFDYANQMINVIQ